MQTGSPSAVVFGPGAERAVETLVSYRAEHVYLVKAQQMLDHLVRPGGFTVSLVMMVAVPVAPAVVAAPLPLTPRKAGPCSPP
jgi:hypothetical protein